MHVLDLPHQVEDMLSCNTKIIKEAISHIKQSIQFDWKNSQEKN